MELVGICDDASCAIALSAITHDDKVGVFDAVFRALQTMSDDQDMSRYADYVFAAVPEAARKHLEDLMATGTREYLSTFARKYVAEGREQGRQEGKTEGITAGKVEDILAVLAARGIELSSEARARIAGCNDLPQLDSWIRRAATVTDASELFD